MASYVPGFDKERFVTTVDRNFLCSICSNVLKDPVLCPRNQHCFCRGCITKHLENSRRCPTCADEHELTVESLASPSGMVKNYLNELKIRCVYENRGCQDIVQSQHLERHETTCGFTPTVCSNQRCGVTVDKCDLIHHESEVCEFRKLKCHSCGEMEKRMANLEKNMERNAADTKGKLEALKTAFDQMKDVLVKVEDKIEENPRKRRRTASGDKENIIVAGGFRTDSVEMFNWRQRTWSPLQSL